MSISRRDLLKGGAAIAGATIAGAAIGCEKGFVRDTESLKRLDVTNLANAMEIAESPNANRELLLDVVREWNVLTGDDHKPRGRAAFKNEIQILDRRILHNPKSDAIVLSALSRCEFDDIAQEARHKVAKMSQNNPR